MYLETETCLQTLTCLQFILMGIACVPTLPHLAYLVLLRILRALHRRDAPRTPKDRCRGTTAYIRRGNKRRGNPIQSADLYLTKLRLYSTQMHLTGQMQLLMGYFSISRISETTKISILPGHADE